MSASTSFQREEYFSFCKSIVQRASLSFLTPTELFLGYEPNAFSRTSVILWFMGIALLRDHAFSPIYFATSWFLRESIKPIGRNFLKFSTPNICTLRLMLPLHSGLSLHDATMPILRKR